MEHLDTAIVLIPLIAVIAPLAAATTAALTATLGRAKSHGEKSIGTPDPGAVSFALICSTIYDVLTTEREQ